MSQLGLPGYIPFLRAWQPSSLVYVIGLFIGLLISNSTLLRNSLENGFFKKSILWCLIPISFWIKPPESLSLCLLLLAPLRKGGEVPISSYICPLLESAPGWNQLCFGSRRGTRLCQRSGPLCPGSCSPWATAFLQCAD